MGTSPGSRSRKGADDAASTNTSPSKGEKGEGSTSAAVKIPLSKRLPVMTEYQLQAYHSSAIKISADPAHPKSASAKTALPLIVAEMKRRSSGVAVAE